MTGYLINSMFTALTLTIVFELAFAFILGIKRKNNIVLVILVNILTNLVVNLVYRYCSLEMKFGRAKLAALIIILEAAAVITEGMVYKRYSELKYPVLFSFGANSFSFFAGILICIVR